MSEREQNRAALQGWHDVLVQENEQIQKTIADRGKEAQMLDLQVWIFSALVTQGNLHGASYLEAAKADQEHFATMLKAVKKEIEDAKAQLSYSNAKLKVVRSTLGENSPS